MEIEMDILLINTLFYIYNPFVAPKLNECF